MNTKRSTSLPMIRIALVFANFRIVSALPRQWFLMKNQLSIGIKGLTLHGQFAIGVPSYAVTEQHPPRLCRLRPPSAPGGLLFLGRYHEIR